MNASVCKVTLKKPEVCLWKWRPMLPGAQQSHSPVCDERRTREPERERERDPESKRIGQGKEIEERQAEARGAESASKKCRREGLLNQTESRPADVVSLLVLETRARVPSMCCCRCGRLVHAMKPMWAS